MSPRNESVAWGWPMDAWFRRVTVIDDQPRRSVKHSVQGTRPRWLHEKTILVSEWRMDQRDWASKPEGKVGGHCRRPGEATGEGSGTPLQYSCLENPIDGGAWWAAVHGVARSRTRLSDFTFTFHFPALEKETATHSSVLAWRIPGTGEPGGLLSMGSHRVRHNWSNLAAVAAAGEATFS